MQIATPLAFSLVPVILTQTLSNNLTLFTLTHTSSNIEAYEGGYKHESGIEFFTISRKSIVTTDIKTFMKTKDFTYFNKLKKHIKV